VVLHTQPGHELIHNPAFDTYELMFGRLADPHKFNFFHVKFIQFIQGKSDCSLQGSRRRQAGTDRYIPAENTIKTGNLFSPLDQLCGNSQQIIRPAFGRAAQVAQITFKTLPQIIGIDPA
jgi:hypothetical protein